MTTELEGRVVLVTGATRGIGRDVARHLARRGAEIVVGGRDPDAAESTASKIRSEGGAARACASTWRPTNPWIAPRKSSSRPMVVSRSCALGARRRGQGRAAQGLFGERRLRRSRSDRGRRTTVRAGQHDRVREERRQPVVQSLTPSTVMLLGGEPVGPRHVWWNFVSSSQDRIEQAKADWKAGKMKLPVGDEQEFIPLPD